MLNAYFDKNIAVLTAIRDTQSARMAQAAQMAARTIQNDGIIYIFGCGHSHLIALDNFYRAGGLCNVCPILDADLMLNDGAAKSSKMEKMQGLAENILERYCLTDKDCLFIISTSGKKAFASSALEITQISVQSPTKRISPISSCAWSATSRSPSVLDPKVGLSITSVA